MTGLSSVLYLAVITNYNTTTIHRTFIATQGRGLWLHLHIYLHRKSVEQMAGYINDDKPEGPSGRLLASGRNVPDRLELLADPTTPRSRELCDIDRRTLNFQSRPVTA